MTIFIQMCLSCHDYFTNSKYKVIKVFDDQYHLLVFYLQYQSEGIFFNNQYGIFKLRCYLK